MVTITSAVGPTGAEHTVVEITDPDEAAAYLEAAYGARLRLSATAGREDVPLLSHARTDAGRFTVDEVRIAGELKCAPDALDKVVVLWVHGGTVESDCEGMSSLAGVGDITMTAQHDLPFEVRTEDLSVTTVLLDPALVAEVATGLPVAHTALPIRFSSFVPVDDAARRVWQDTTRYVMQTVLGDAGVAGPLVLGQAGRLLAAATLAAFPNAVTAEDCRADRAENHPALLRRAVDFIEANAGNDIALGDIASAVHISPRAVQYMFRRHLETTPLQYLRRLRLHHAHQDLLAGNPVDDTVTSIAARWGFAHTGRFAVQYRETYGRSPHHTLRD